MMYKYFIEEQKNSVNSSGISEEFYQKIKGNKVKLIEEVKQKNNSQNDEMIFKFVYVGIITYLDDIIIVLPKYFDENFITKLDCITKLIHVFKKIEKHEIKDPLKRVLFTKLNENIYSEISVCDFIIRDFIENGYYLKQNKVHKMNSRGKINWQKTISMVQPVFSSGFPIYADCYYSDKINNENYYITLIHKAVIEYSIAKYAKLLDYKLSSVKYEVAKKKIQALGNTRTIIGYLEKELECVFEDRQSLLLKVLLSFFKKNEIRYKDNNISLYGTSSFELVWQDVCSKIFNNQYEDFIKDMPQILWRSTNGKMVSNDQNMLEPDILREYKNDFIILDAKYYSIKLNDSSISKNPGSYDIVKQHTYKLAFMNKGYNNIINILIYPREMKELYKIFGSVNLEFFNQEPIINIFISPRLLWNMYLKNESLSDKELEVFIDMCLKFIEKEIKIRKNIF